MIIRHYMTTLVFLHRPLYFITNVLIRLPNISSTVYEVYIEFPFTLLIKTKPCGCKGVDQRAIPLFTQWDLVHKTMISEKVYRHFSDIFTNQPLNDVAI